jgi:hypothetical protein
MLFNPNYISGLVQADGSFHISFKAKIVNLAYNMNLEGKRRKLTKEVYLKSVNLDSLFIGGPKKAEVLGSLLRAGRGSLFTVSFKVLINTVV